MQEKNATIFLPIFKQFVEIRPSFLLYIGPIFEM